MVANVEPLYVVDFRLLRRKYEHLWAFDEQGNWCLRVHTIQEFDSDRRQRAFNELMHVTRSISTCLFAATRVEDSKFLLDRLTEMDPLVGVAAVAYAQEIGFENHMPIRMREVIVSLRGLPTPQVKAGSTAARLCFQAIDPSKESWAFFDEYLKTLHVFKGEYLLDVFTLSICDWMLCGKQRRIVIEKFTTLDTKDFLKP